MRIPIVAVAAAVLIAFSFAACGGGSFSAPDSTDLPTGSPSFPSDDGGSSGGGGGGDGGGGTGSPAEVQHQFWTDAGIADYTFTLTRQVFGPPLYNAPVVVVVRAGAVTSRTYQQTGLPVAARDASWWPDIDGLFGILEDAYAKNADQISATYDPTHGYPTSASIDYDFDLGDDEHSFSVTGFTAP